MLQRTCPSVSALTSLESPVYLFWNVSVISLPAGVVTACNRRTLQAFPKVEKIQDQMKMKWKQSNLKGFQVGLFPLHFRLMFYFFLLSLVFLDAQKPTPQIPIPPGQRTRIKTSKGCFGFLSKEIYCKLWFRHYVWVNSVSCPWRHPCGY